MAAPLVVNQTARDRNPLATPQDILKWYHDWPGTIRRRFDSYYLDKFPSSFSGKTSPCHGEFSGSIPLGGAYKLKVVIKTIKKWQTK